MELFNLEGKTALITGASSGLGFQFAQVLSNAGAKVILAARRMDRLENLAKEISEKGGEAIPIQMNVSKKESILSALKPIFDQGEPIDILVNNAGMGRATPIFDDQENHVFEEIFQTNFIGLWHVTKAVANYMRNKGTEGSIINIASINGIKASAHGHAAYSSSKAAVIRMTEQLVGELAEHHIRINVIAPGFFKSEMTAGMIQSHGDKLRDLIPLKFIADPKDLDGLLLLLASNKASRYITGSCIVIDGGISWFGNRKLLD